MLKVLLAYARRVINLLAIALILAVAGTALAQNKSDAAFAQLIKFAHHFSELLVTGPLEDIDGHGHFNLSDLGLARFYQTHFNDYL